MASPNKTVTWPPKVAESKNLGYLKDSNGTNYPRDIGKSTLLSNGDVLFQFGDTFTPLDGMVRNTVSVIRSGDRSNPVISSYNLPSSNPATGAGVGQSTKSERRSSGFFGKMKDMRAKMKGGNLGGGEGSGAGKEHVRPLIEFFEDEKSPDDSTWFFSGIVETSNENGVIKGLIWYEKNKHNLTNGETKFEYTGLAEMTYEGRNGKLSSRRLKRDGEKRALFEGNEPRFGTFATLVHEGHVYAYGQMGNDSTDIAVACVPIHEASHRHKYTYFDGSSFVPEISSTKPMEGLARFQHGQIFPTTMFGSSHPWAFIGCSAFGDSKIIIGRGQQPEGPWETVPLMDADVIFQKPKDWVFTYCMYPHTWVSDQENELMITWSEGTMQGNVIAARVKLQTE